jgi:predicted nucleic acid-binding protein
MIYLDTSYIIKCYLHEPGTPQVLRLVQTHPGRAACQHGRTEFWSAVHRHVREGALTRAQAGKVFRQFERDEKQGLWHWLPLDHAVVLRSCAMFEKLGASVFLRSADALHLACAAQNGFAEIYSNDRHLLASATYFGLTACNVI